ncbi:hypothetical protein [Yoonia sp. 67]|uniref:hypothetical protein n=1 Tax=Yoonia sp. 67 TaxID=3081449 RepID=UPI002AFF03FB|nr:hypothetical protein [Yoonia sp. 67]
MSDTRDLSACYKEATVKAFAKEFDIPLKDAFAYLVSDGELLGLLDTIALISIKQIDQGNHSGAKDGLEKFSQSLPPSSGWKAMLLTCFEEAALK